MRYEKSLPKLPVALTVAGVSMVSCEFSPLRLLSTCHVGMLTPAVEAAVTVADAVPLTVFTFAVMVVVPAATPVAKPDVSIVAAEVFEELHVAVEVTFPVVPLL